MVSGSGRQKAVDPPKAGEDIILIVNPVRAKGEGVSNKRADH
jgi:hypothetical protein